ncbi:Methyltransferase OMS1 [Trichoderma ghanense]|uniref:Methyltransferase OMS1 n=1 Tax=Trichoderma ghanense TaxID=65468 RepID=A0ABY2HEM7_9HYPO
MSVLFLNNAASMNVPTRRLATVVVGSSSVPLSTPLQRRLASSSAVRQAVKTPPAKATPPPASRVTRSYKPTQKPSSSPSSTPPPPPEPPKADTLLTIWRRAWLPLTGASLLAGFLGFYIFGTTVATIKTTPSSSSPSHPCEHATPTGRPPALTGDNAEQFDKELNLPEWWMGITKLRKKLAAHAKGAVLELAMGSGRNLEYYNWEPLSTAVEAARTGNIPPPKVPQGITSFTGLDISVDMLDVSRKRLAKSVPPMASSAPVVKASSMADHTGGQLSFLDGHVRLVNSDAHRPLPPPAHTDKYDTVIQTFGLCSVSDPVAVLSNLATVVRPGTGRIILLEHGKGYYGLVNGLLDKNAGKHFAKYGCWWNRDIEAIVEDAVAATPGLEVVKIERPNITQMGTLVWVELKLAASAKKT